MPSGTELADSVDAVALGDSSPASGRARSQAAHDAARSDGTSAGRGSLSNLSPAGHLLLPVAIFIVTFLTIEFSHSSHFVVTLWPSNAAVLAALLCHSRNLRNYGSIVAGGACALALASVASGNGVGPSAILAAANMFEVAVVLALLSLFKIDAANLLSFKNLLVFLVIAAGVAPIGSSAVGAAALGPVHDVPWRTMWLHFYPSHALGIIVVTPFLISITLPNRGALTDRRAEAAMTLAIVVTIGLCAVYFRPLVFLVVPAILYATLRFGVIGATTANLLVAFMSSIFVVLGIGEPLLSRPQLPDRVLALQVFLTFTSLWCLPIAVLLKERDRLLHDLSLANSQLKLESETQSHLVIGLRRHLSIAEEKERLRLSYELHDQAGQGLIAAILQLNEIDPLVQGLARERLHLVRKKMEELGKTLHRIAWELRPPSIDELGLRKALASYIADWSEQCATDVDFHCDEQNLDGVPNEIGTAVYRIVQEGLTNIVKHAGYPSDVSVVIRRVGATLQVIIEDNGCGFDVGAMTAKPGGYLGLGLAGMRERLTLIGGTLEIESAIGAGTTIFARIALDGQRSAA
jgi:signal transduction histidine kinase